MFALRVQLRRSQPRDGRLRGMRPHYRRAAAGGLGRGVGPGRLAPWAAPDGRRTTRHGARPPSEAGAADLIGRVSASPRRACTSARRACLRCALCGRWFHVLAVGRGPPPPRLRPTSPMGMARPMYQDENRPLAGPALVGLPVGWLSFARRFLILRVGEMLVAGERVAAVDAGRLETDGQLRVRPKLPADGGKRELRAEHPADAAGGHRGAFRRRLHRRPPSARRPGRTHRPPRGCGPRGRSRAASPSR